MQHNNLQSRLFYFDVERLFVVHFGEVLLCLQDGHVEKHLMIELHSLEALLLDQLINLRKETLAFLIQLDQFSLLLCGKAILLLLLIIATAFLPVLLDHFLGNHPHFLSFLLILAEEVEIVAGMEVPEAPLAEVDGFLLDGAAASTNPMGTFGPLYFWVIGEAKGAIL